MPTAEYVPPGRMRHRITVQLSSEASDGAGGTVTTWTDTVSAWAALEPLTGRETREAAGIGSSVTHTVTMRYRTGIAPSARVVYGARVFRVVAVRDPEERKRQLILDCVEVLSEAAG